MIVSLDMLRFASLTLLCGMLAAGCATFDPHHPLVGRPQVDAARGAYFIWFAKDEWHLRIAPGHHGHRFQGSMAGVRGGVSDLDLTRPELRDRIALVGDAVQFDLEGRPGSAAEGFDAKVLGACARFDLYVDGRHRPELVRLGPRSLPARRMPFEKCP